MACSRWQRRLRSVAHDVAVMAVVVVVVCLASSCESAPEQRLTRSRKAGGGGGGSGGYGRAKKAVCTDKDQKKMSDDFNECINKFTQIHHENMGRSMSPEDSQKFTCQMLADTVNCGSVWKDCHTEAEVRSIKDSHIAARINQFAGAAGAKADGGGGGVDITLCEVVREYVESGRAEQVQHTTEGSCTNREVTAVQSAFQSCSHNLSTVAWDKIKDLQDSRMAALQVSAADETNDILEEEERLDAAGGAAGLVTDDELRPMLCSTLMEIGNKCVLSITKCFSREDINLMRDQHVQTMAGYYSSLYDHIDLSSCHALTAFSVDNVSDDDDDYDYNYVDEDDDYDDGGYDQEEEEYNYDSYEDEDFDYHKNTQVGEDQVQAPDEKEAATTSSTTTTEPAPSSATSPSPPSEPEHQKRAPSQLPVSSSDEMPASGVASQHASVVAGALLIVPVVLQMMQFH